MQTLQAEGGWAGDWVCPSLAAMRTGQGAEQVQYRLGTRHTVGTVYERISAGRQILDERRMTVHDP